MAPIKNGDPEATFLTPFPSRMITAQSGLKDSTASPQEADSSDRQTTVGEGFTLVELLIVMAVIGILAALAIPKLNEAVEQARVARAIGDIKAFGQDVTEFHFMHGRFPSSLAEAGRPSVLDPWGNEYEYAIVTGPGGARKDKFLVPINDDFDLYSMGRDGKTAGPLTAASSQDDIVRANNGGFVGLASRY